MFVSFGGSEHPTQAMRPVFTDPLELMEGKLFAERYRIIHELGRGGMGRVYRALDQELDIEIAIKVIRPEYLDDEKMVKRFKNEILLSREVSHENIVRIHDFSEWRGIKYITMQLIDGMTLRSILNETGRLQIEEALAVAIQICHGLEAARKKGIAHRDLKPQNILVDNDRHVYIADFGLARAKGQSNVSVTGVIIGTPEYISPEQWRGGHGDFRSDIYSLGIMLFEMLTGRSLFQSDTELGYLQKHLNEAPVFDSAARKAIPEYLRRIILRCLSKDPESRYQTAALVEADLIARRASKPPLKVVIRNSLSQRKALLPFILLLILGGIWLQRFMKPPAEDPSRSLIVVPFANNTGEARYAFWSESLADLVITDLRQSHHLRIAPQERVQAFLATYPDWKPGQSLSPEQMSVLSREAASNFLLVGELNNAGSRFRVSVRILSLQSGEIIESFQSDGLGEESLFGIIDSISDKTKLALNLSREMILKDIDKDIRQISTRSIDALKAYSTGKEYFHLGQFNEAIREFERSIEADPDFAMAYAAAAYAMANYGDPRMGGFFEKALSLSDRVSKRERLLIQGRYLNLVRGDFKKALAVYQTLLKDYPHDLDAWESLAVINRNMENWGESNRAFREWEKLSPGRALVGVNLFSNALEQGLFGEAQTILERYKTELQRTKRLHYLQYHLYFSQGQLERAKDELNMSRAEEGNSLRHMIIMGNLLLLEDQFEAAANQYLLAWNSLSELYQKERVIGSMTNLDLHSGKMREPLNRIDQLRREALDDGDFSLARKMETDALRVLVVHGGPGFWGEARERMKAILNAPEHEQNLHQRFDNLYLYGRLLLTESNSRELDDVLKEMDRVVASLGAPKARFALHLRALDALSKGRLDEAENLYHKAYRLFPNPQMPMNIWDFDQTLARIKMAAGEYDEAIAIYESLISRKGYRLEYPVAWIRAHVELAKLQMRSGRSSRALEHARKVVSWWGKGDYAPELAQEMRQLIADA